MSAWYRITLAALWMSGFSSGTLQAADADPHEADRKALLAIASEVEAGINDQSIDRMLATMVDDVTIIWLNAEVSRGKDDAKAYYGRMVGSDQAILKKYLTKVKVGAPARFYGDVAVADGSSADEFFPNGRGPFNLDSRWSATLAKTPGGWKVVSLHLSANVFTNPLIDEAKTFVVYAVAVGVTVGFAAMWLLTLLRRRRR